MAKLLFESFNELELISEFDIRKCDRRMFNASCSFFIIPSDAKLEKC